MAEWLYLDWASRAPKPLPDTFVHAEWITLHDNVDFRDFLGFLRAELDRIGPAQADLCRDFFRRAVTLERLSAAILPTHKSTRRTHLGFMYPTLTFGGP